MQNLSISCALVCLIVLGSAALVGAFGVFTHQISAVLVTGVMYLLAATFALFTLTILHFKRHQVKSRPEGRPLQCDASSAAAMLVDGVFASTAALHARQTLDGSFLTARLFSSGWSMELGWGGMALCLLASVSWILLSKIMRYSPISTLMS
ncbi:uncharacterized protein LOC134538102 [Bacillus rossius redtenbacheri]|uniref:uncharacterized protein LOC134538102 n=1 Tax=Bacillus rossius redtenbacheri TaxID=93214 RepID=UPI002FDCE99B